MEYEHFIIYDRYIIPVGKPVSTTGEIGGWSDAHFSSGFYAITLREIYGNVPHAVVCCLPAKDGLVLGLKPADLELKITAATKNKSEINVFGKFVLIESSRIFGEKRVLVLDKIEFN